MNSRNIGGFEFNCPMAFQEHTKKSPGFEYFEKSSRDTLGQVYFRVLKCILPYIFVLLRITKN